MKKSLKVFLYKDGSNKLTAHHRPFYPTKNYEVEITKNPNEADYILTKPANYRGLINDVNFKNSLNKVVVYANDDHPNYLLQDKNSKKLIAQPLHGKEKLKEFNATTVPLLMTDHETIHLDKDFIEKCRNQEKVYDYYFVGQVYGNRKQIMSLNLPNSIIKTTGSIYGLNAEQKLQKIKDFLMDLGKAKFGFAPRGVGSNSFRLYECLMVGTVPISTDVITYPFEDEVGWDSFSVRGSLNNLPDLIEKTKNIDYETVRDNGIYFWENYCKMDTLYDKILGELWV